MAQQTAVEWLIEQCPRIETIVAYNILEEAKEMEKEQIIDAFDTGTTDKDRIGKEYYNETYDK